MLVATSMLSTFALKCLMLLNSSANAAVATEAYMKC